MGSSILPMRSSSLYAGTITESERVGLVPTIAASRAARCAGPNAVCRCAVTAGLNTHASAADVGSTARHANQIHKPILWCVLAKSDESWICGRSEVLTALARGRRCAPGAAPSVQSK